MHFSKIFKSISMLFCTFFSIEKSSPLQKRVKNILLSDVSIDKNILFLRQMLALQHLKMHRSLFLTSLYSLLTFTNAGLINLSLNMKPFLRTSETFSSIKRSALRILSLSVHHLNRLVGAGYPSPNKLTQNVSEMFGVSKFV